MHFIALRYKRNVINWQIISYNYREWHLAKLKTDDYDAKHLEYNPPKVRVSGPGFAGRKNTLSGATLYDVHIEITGCVLTFIHTCICNVPNSGCLYNVPNDKLLDGFIFRDTSSTIGTAHEFNMPTAMLGASSITPLLSLGK